LHRHRIKAVSTAAQQLTTCILQRAAYLAALMLLAGLIAHCANIHLAAIIHVICIVERYQPLHHLHLLRIAPSPARPVPECLQSLTSGHVQRACSTGLAVQRLLHFPLQRQGPAAFATSWCSGAGTCDIRGVTKQSWNKLNF
jgi:hypothetical protein